MIGDVFKGTILKRANGNLVGKCVGKMPCRPDSLDGIGERSIVIFLTGDSFRIGVVRGTGAFTERPGMIFIGTGILKIQRILPERVLLDVKIVHENRLIHCGGHFIDGFFHCFFIGGRRAVYIGIEDGE